MYRYHKSEYAHAKVFGHITNGLKIKTGKDGLKCGSFFINIDKKSKLFSKNYVINVIIHNQKLLNLYSKHLVKGEKVYLEGDISVIDKPKSASRMISLEIYQDHELTLLHH